MFPSYPTNNYIQYGVGFNTPNSKRTPRHPELTLRTYFGLGALRPQSGDNRTISVLIASRLGGRGGAKFELF